MHQDYVNLISFPVITDTRGDLTYLEAGKDIPFEIRRTYYLYNVPKNKNRGGHAHRDLEQVMFALSGSFRVKVDNGRHKKNFILNSPSQGLYINKLVWREMDCFSQDAICMVLASQHYCEGDYLRKYEDFLQELSTKPL